MTFKELFGLGENNGTLSDKGLENEATISPAPTKDVPEELFVNSKPPLTSQIEESDNIESPIRLLLSKRWYAFGYDDGYATVNSEKKNARVKSIISELHLTISKTIEIIENEIEKISMQSILLDNDADLNITQKQVELKKKGLEHKINQLEKDLELIYKQEGKMSKPTHDYMNGFSEGVHVRIKRDLLSKELNIL